MEFCPVFLFIFIFGVLGGGVEAMFVGLFIFVSFSLWSIVKLCTKSWNKRCYVGMLLKELFFFFVFCYSSFLIIRLYVLQVQIAFHFSFFLTRKWVNFSEDWHTTDHDVIYRESLWFKVWKIQPVFKVLCKNWGIYYQEWCTFQRQSPQSQGIVQTQKSNLAFPTFCFYSL